MADVELMYDERGKTYRVFSSQYLEYIRNHFSFENKAKRWVKNPMKRKYIPDRIYFIQKNGKFDNGLFAEIIEFCKEKGFSIHYDSSLSLVNRNNFSNPILHQLNLPLRDYQEQTILSFLKIGSGIAHLATGAGKTLTLATLIFSIIKNNGYDWDTNPHQYVVMIPNIGLLNQTFNDFVSYGVPESAMTLWSGGVEPDRTKKIVFCSYSILISESQETEWMQGCDYLFVDEVHGLKKANEIFKFVRKIPTWNKYGFTGTLPNEELDRFNLLTHFGPIIAKKDSSELRESGTLTEVEVNALILNYGDEKPNKPEDWTPTALYEAEIQFLVTHEKRNRLITKIVDRNENSLILVDRIEHGMRLLDMFGADPKVHFITGEMSVEDREAIISRVEGEYGHVIIAIAKIFSVGINIKNLHTLVFASTSKSETKIVQSIGRILRKHPSKKRARVFDIADALRYTTEHFTKRLAIYESQQIEVKLTKIKI